MKNDHKIEATNKLLVLDWDGTLFDNLALLYLCICEVFKRYDIQPPTIEKYRQEIGVNFMEFFLAHGLPESVTIEEVQKILKEVKYGYYEQEDNPLQIALREDAIEVLSKCKDLGIKTAVISAEVPEVLEKGLSRSGAKPLLDYYRGLTFQKGTALLETCALFKIAPAYAFYVDDLAEGIKEAKKVGVIVCGMLNNGHNSSEKVLEAKPDFPVNSLTEVLREMRHHYEI